MELLIVILVFAACAAICVNLFSSSFEIATNAHDTENATTLAENGAECYKAMGGNIEAALDFLGGRYYNEYRLPCSASEATYELRLSELSDAPRMCSLSVVRADGVELIAFTVAAGGEAQ